MRFIQTAQFTLFAIYLASSNLCAMPAMNLSAGVTPVSHAIYQLHMLILLICIVIGALVFGVMGYAIIYHRKSLGVKPAEFHEHFWLEITWAIVPLIILILMAIPATIVLIRMNDTKTADITIKITGYQWKWQYDYLDYQLRFFSNIKTPREQITGKTAKSSSYLQEVDHPLVVPIHRKIRFLITSADVIHSWWVMDLGVKHDAVPGFINESWARINKAGIYHGQCAELCGMNHAYMPIVVIALPEKDFENWIAEQKGEKREKRQDKTVEPVTASLSPAKVVSTTSVPAGSPSKLDALMKQGEQIYLTTCAVCHQADGSGMPPVFPALNASKITAGELNAHVDVVLNGRPGTAMQAFKEQLSDEELAAVITYERNVFGHQKEVIVTPEEIKARKK